MQVFYVIQQTINRRGHLGLPQPALGITTLGPPPYSISLPLPQGIQKPRFWSFLSPSQVGQYRPNPCWRGARPSWRWALPLAFLYLVFLSGVQSILSLWVRRKYSHCTHDCKKWFEGRKKLSICLRKKPLCQKWHKVLACQ